MNDTDAPRAGPITPEQQSLICAYVDRHHQEQVAFLAELVKVPSDNPPGDCAPHASRTAELLEGMGLAVERHPVPMATVAAMGMRSVTNLVVRKRFGPGPVIGLNAHGDVVPPGEGWSVDPYSAEIRDGKMFGRGVAVSKSDFATYTFALRAIMASGLPLAGSIEIHLTYDEETGGLLGPGWLLDQQITKPDYMISAWFTHSVVIAHNGCLHLEIRVEGRSAHAARPDTGVDALEAANTILTALYELRQTYRSIRSAVTGIDHPTLVIGLISGGINTNVVPDLVTMRLDRRIIPEEDPELVERDLVSFVERVAASLPAAKVSVRRILLARPFTPQPGQERLVSTIQFWGRALLGEEIPAVGIPLFTDARLYSTAGIPTVLYGAGPRSILEANGHRADEQLVLEDLRKATQVVALSIVDLLWPHSKVTASH